jgi:hypothetical protein
MAGRFASWEANGKPLRNRKRYNSPMLRPPRALTGPGGPYASPWPLGEGFMSQHNYATLRHTTRIRSALSAS